MHKKDHEDAIKNLVQASEIKEVIEKLEDNTIEPVQVDSIDLNKEIPDTFSDGGIETAKPDEDIKQDNNMVNDNSSMDYGFKNYGDNTTEQF